MASLDDIPGVTEVDGATERTVEDGDDEPDEAAAAAATAAATPAATTRSRSRESLP